MTGIPMMCVVAAVCCVAILATAGGRPTPDLSELDAVVRRGMEEQRYPGAVLLVAISGRVVYHRAFGRHTYEPGSPPMTPNTVFDLASCTKVMAGTPAALCLVEDGRLDLTRPVSSWWPEFTAGGKADVTLTDLLSHVSGLKAYENYKVVEEKRLPGEKAYEALYRHYAGLPLAYKPRTKMVYSCLNLQCVAAVVQKVAGESLEDVLRRRVWLPLGMKDTTFRPRGRLLARCAPTMVDEAGRPVRGRVHDPLAAYHGSEELCPGNAGLFSTASDMARYAEMILGEGLRRGRRVFQSDTVRWMTTVATPSRVKPPRSIGWAVYTDPPFVPSGPQAESRRTIGHTGYTGTWMWIHPPTRSYIIFLTNRVYPSPATSGGEGRSIDDIRAEIARVVTGTLSR